MIASLGMYDRAETARALDRFWAAIRDGLGRRRITAPKTLTRGKAAYWPAWQAPDLVFSQTCGLPFRAVLHKTVDLIGTPDHAVEGCPPGYYRSVFVARANDPRPWPEAFSGAPFAVSEALSQSGWAAAAAWFAARGLDLCPAFETGSHHQSALAVLHKRADFAAIDAVTWSLMFAHEHWTAGLKVIGHTDPSPGLPCITARGGDTKAMFDAVAGAIAAIGPTDRATLRLRGIIHIPAASYLALSIPDAPVFAATPAHRVPAP
jgi:ABC-type phosphate/phosphonate transport system substrate-binding protein